MRESNRPVGTAYAIYTEDNGGTKMVQMGPIFRTKRGNFLFRMESTPVVWGDPHVSRQVVFKFDAAQVRIMRDEADAVDAPAKGLEERTDDLPF